MKMDKELAVAFNFKDGVQKRLFPEGYFDFEGLTSLSGKLVDYHWMLGNNVFIQIRYLVRNLMTMVLVNHQDIKEMREEITSLDSKVRELNKKLATTNTGCGGSCGGNCGCK